MSFFNIFKKNNASNRLIGLWKSIENNTEDIEDCPYTTMEFKNNGELVYTIHEGIKKQIMLLTYMVDGNKIISNQPSHPKEEITLFKVLEGDILELDYSGDLAKYQKINDCNSQ